MSSSASSSRRAARARKRTGPSPYYFDETAAARVTQFFELFLVHSKGEWAGQPFRLEAWQARIIRQAFGWKRRSDHLRRYRTLYIRVPKKNGKSTLAAGIACYLTFADGEPGAEVYGIANDKMQAKIVFGEAVRMVRACPELRDMCQIYKEAIVVPDTMASYQALSSESGNKDGLNTHGLVVDELHEFTDRKLWGTLMTAMASRRPPMAVVCTTAGVGRHTLYAEVDGHAQKVADGTVQDDSFLPVLFGAPTDADWHSPRTWRSANPNYGISVKPEFLEEQHRKAVLMPGYENSFKRYHLNIDTEQDVRWLSMDAWDRCGEPIEEAALAGAECYVGLDLSSRKDITASVAVFPRDNGEYWALARFYVPAEALAEREKRDDVPYARWVEQGLMCATPGNVIDYSFIRADLERWAKAHDVREIAYDPWGATQLALQLQDDGMTCVEHRQGFKSMSEPAKKLEELMLGRKLRHGGNPVLRWMAGNAAVEVDAAENIKPSKKRSTARIDGVVALCMGLGRATLNRQKPSVYDSRGLIVLGGA